MEETITHFLPGNSGSEGAERQERNGSRNVAGAWREGAWRASGEVVLCPVLGVLLVAGVSEVVLVLTAGVVVVVVILRFGVVVCEGLKASRSEF